MILWWSGYVWVYQESGWYADCWKRSLHKGLLGVWTFMSTHLLFRMRDKDR